MTLLADRCSVATVGECALRKPDQVVASAELLSALLLLDEGQIESGEDDANLS
jgi:DNA mismatch endonuclease, patch repair protein